MEDNACLCESAVLKLLCLGVEVFYLVALSQFFGLHVHVEGVVVFAWSKVKSLFSQEVHYSTGGVSDLQESLFQVHFPRDLVSCAGLDGRNPDGEHLVVEVEVLDDVSVTKAWDLLFDVQSLSVTISPDIFYECHLHIGIQPFRLVLSVSSQISLEV